MSDDAAPGDDALSRVFDYFKHLTTVSLIGIGGVLGLLKGEGPTLKPIVVVLVVGALALGGVIGMMMLSAIATLDLKGEPDRVIKARKALWIAQLLATFAVMFGLGIFLGSFVAVLNR